MSMAKHFLWYTLQNGLVLIVKKMSGWDWLLDTQDQPQKLKKKKRFLLQIQLINKTIKDGGGITTWKTRRILPAVYSASPNVEHLQQINP